MSIGSDHGWYPQRGVSRQAVCGHIALIRKGQDVAQRSVTPRAWEHGGRDWQRYEVPWRMCPRISAAFIEQERRSLPRLWFASEYESEFVAPDDVFFSAESIARLIDPAITPLFPIGEDGA